MIFFLRAFAWLIKTLPRPLALKAGCFFGFALRLLLPQKKKVCRRNLDLAFGDRFSRLQKERIIASTYANLGKNVIDFLRIPLLTRESFSSLVSVKGEEHLVEARKKGKGVLVITAHYGFWDIIPVYFAFRGFGANLITKHIRNPSLNRFWMEYRTWGGVNPIFKKNSAREIVSILRRNESLGFVIDQNIHSRSGVFVDFFGIPACTVDAVAKLAAGKDIPVLPIFCIRKPDETFLVEISPPVPLAQGSSKEEIVRSTTQEYSKVLEKYVLERPDHWIWMHKRWKNRPEGGENLYS